jgi:hypothetical protein
MDAHAKWERLKIPRDETERNLFTGFSARTTMSSNSGSAIRLKRFSLQILGVLEHSKV